MYFSQQDIDNETMGGQILTNNPNGGAGGDSTAYCLILPDPNNPTKPLKWKPSLDSTDESTWHNIGIPYYPGNNIGFQVYDFKNVASAYNTQQTVFNMGIKGKLVSIGCIPLIPTDASHSFYFEEPATSGGASGVFLSPLLSSYAFNVPASSTLNINRFFIPYNYFWSGYWYMRTPERNIPSIPCVWFMEVGNDPFVDSFTVVTAGEAMPLPMPADANAELESVCLIPSVNTSVSVSFANSSQYWYKGNTDTAFPATLTTGVRKVFWYHSNNQIPSGVNGLPKLQIKTNHTINVHIRYKDPNM